MTNCETYQEMISCLLDGELSPQDTQSLHAHLETCPDCRHMYKAFSALSDSLAGDLEAPPAQLAPGVMFKLRAGAAAPPRRRRKYIGRAAALAACLAVVIFASTRLQPTGNRVSLAREDTATAEDAAPMAEAAGPEAFFAADADLNAPASEPEAAPQPDAAPDQAVVSNGTNDLSENGDPAPEPRQSSGGIADLPAQLSLSGTDYVLTGTVDTLPEGAALWADAAPLPSGDQDQPEAVSIPAETWIFQVNDSIDALYLCLPDGGWAVYTPAG